jgi:hypothetical protein
MSHQMKKITAALVISALLMPAAYAQNLPESDHQKAEEAKKKAEQKANEEAYKSAVKRMPDANQKADPWGDLRTPSANGNK